MPPTNSTNGSTTTPFSTTFEILNVERIIAQATMIDASANSIPIPQQSVRVSALRTEGIDQIRFFTGTSSVLRVISDEESKSDILTHRLPKPNPTLCGSISGALPSTLRKRSGLNSIGSWYISGSCSMPLLQTK